MPHGCESPVATGTTRMRGTSAVCSTRAAVGAGTAGTPSRPLGGHGGGGGEGEAEREQRAAGAAMAHGFLLGCPSIYPIRHPKGSTAGRMRAYRP